MNRLRNRGKKSSICSEPKSVNNHQISIKFSREIDTAHSTSIKKTDANIKLENIACRRIFTTNKEIERTKHTLNRECEKGKYKCV
jgi:hypothetical protein